MGISLYLSTCPNVHMLEEFGILAESPITSAGKVVGGETPDAGGIEWVRLLRTVTRQSLLQPKEYVPDD